MSFPLSNSVSALFTRTLSEMCGRVPKAAPLLCSFQPSERQIFLNNDILFGQTRPPWSMTIKNHSLVGHRSLCLCAEGLASRSHVHRISVPWLAGSRCCPVAIHGDYGSQSNTTQYQSLHSSGPSQNRQPGGDPREIAIAARQ